MSGTAKLLATASLLVAIAGSFAAPAFGQAPDPALALREILNKAQAADDAAAAGAAETEATDEVRTDIAEPKAPVSRTVPNDDIETGASAWAARAMSASTQGTRDGDPSGPAAPPDMAAAIDAEIRALLDEATGPIAGLGGHDITIDELDRMNREAARSATSLDLERTRLERIKTQLDILMLLREAAAETATKEPETGGEARDAQTESERAAAAEKAAAEANAAREAAALQAEQAGLPRIGEVVGIGGRFEARIILPDGAEIRAGNGMQIPGGYRVAEISDGGVILLGRSGNRYMIAPGGGPAPQPARDRDQEDRDNPVVDLGGFPVGIF